MMLFSSRENFPFSLAGSRGQITLIQLGTLLTQGWFAVFICLGLPLFHPQFEGIALKEFQLRITIVC